MYEYKAKLIKVVDGDTVDVDIDLGFGVWLRNERVRIMGIDTPESRTRDKVEKLFGLAAKKALKELLKKDVVLKTFKGRGGEDAKGKFGRILGDFSVYYGKEDRWCMATEIMAKEGHCVPYTGGSKEDTQSAHLKNRQKLLSEGVVDQKAYDKWSAYMEKRNKKS
jgi:micrococcal nuclease